MQSYNNAKLRRRKVTTTQSYDDAKLRQRFPGTVASLQQMKRSPDDSSLFVRFEGRKKLAASLGTRDASNDEASPFFFAAFCFVTL
jgi:hypothetical protein